MTTQPFGAKAFACALTLALLGASPMAARAAQRSVVELYTSQGCSSCPPADALLEKLATDPTIIAVSLPVDYWDNLGWKDTFAKPAFSQRQRAYSLARGDHQVYTPQAVINGAIHANGASRHEIAAAIAETHNGLNVPLELTREGGTVTVKLGADTAGQASRVATILVMPVIGRREVAIGRGENARTTVAYTNIAREVISLGRWSGSAATHAVPAEALADADSVIVILQSGSPDRPGPILAASQVTLK